MAQDADRKSVEGLLLVDKPTGCTSFSLIRATRRCTGVQKIGHAGTLDPLATGVMILLLGRRFTRLSSLFLNRSKEYISRFHLGITTDTYDADGQVTGQSAKVPTLAEVEQAVLAFQGNLRQVPPMFSAKKHKGRKLYELAREGTVVERPEVEVQVQLKLISYTYPHLTVHVACSKGTYVRSIAHDLGAHLGCGAHVDQLQRTAVGPFRLSQCLPGTALEAELLDLTPYLITDPARWADCEVACS
jgi:tRNA pseudouridine55 synthase